jgi:hypothetical protein
MQPTPIETYRMLRKLGASPDSAKHQTTAYYARKWHMPYEHVRALVDIELGKRRNKPIQVGAL